MLTEPEDLDRDELRVVLERRWGFGDALLEYTPVGFGSHHWRAVDAGGVPRFVTVDDLRASFQWSPDTDATFDALGRAYRTASSLHDEAALEFVVAPLRDDDGIVVRRLSDRYAVTVSPFVVGESSGWGPYESADDRRDMGRIVGRLHAATERLCADLPRRDDLAVPARAALAQTSSVIRRAACGSSTGTRR